MKFWDTSAVVPLCVNEPRSAGVRTILAEDPSIVVWWATRTECVSAFMRQIRDKNLHAGGERQARHVLQTLARAWTEIQPSEVVRGTAERLLAVHSLPAADAPASRSIARGAKKLRICFCYFRRSFGDAAIKRALLFRLTIRTDFLLLSAL